MKLHLGPILISGLLASCHGFAAKRGGGGGKKKTASKKGRGGFGSSTIASTSETQTATPRSSTELQEIDLGPAKTVYINVPPNALAPEQMKKEDMRKFASATSGSGARSKLLDEYGSFRGRGDVIWPSSLHLSRLIANCPSFVTDRKVIDLGCGLGLASLATLLGRPSSLTLSDVDESVLNLAVRSCTEMLGVMTNPPVKSVDQLQLDWANKSTWPQLEGEYDVVLASDILYDDSAAEYVADAIAHLLLRPHRQQDDSGADEESISGRALIVDPANRKNREAFVLKAARNGLLAEAAPFPGQEEEFVLINVTPA